MEERFDKLLAQKEGFSRTRAQELIKNGNVFVNGKPLLKPSILIGDDVEISIKNQSNYLSRGAFKLDKALKVFDVSLDGKVVLDMGASTGGFTQVSLENGAKKVYSVDVGRGELHEKLRKDERVVNLENTDIRTLTKEMVGDSQIVVGDLSFISLKHILPKINQLFGKIEMILLFKPQFECGKEIARKSRGVVKDKKIHINLLEDFIREIKIYDFSICDITYSPITGKEGNIEYLLHINGKNDKEVELKNIVMTAFQNFNKK